MKKINLVAIYYEWEKYWCANGYSKSSLRYNNFIQRKCAKCKKTNVYPLNNFISPAHYYSSHRLELFKDRCIIGCIFCKKYLQKYFKGK